MLPVDILEMRKRLLTPYPVQPRQKAEEILKTFDLFVCEVTH